MEIKLAIVNGGFMKLFSFLKSRAGLLNLSAGKMALVGLSIGALGLNMYNYMSDRPAAQEERVRGFSEILASGGNLPGDTTMNISSGNVQFATSEEIAAMNGGDSTFDAGDGQIAAFSGALGSVNVHGSALSAGEDGLGMGADAAVELGPDGEPMGGPASTTSSSVVTAAVNQANQTQINKLGEEGRTLQRAAIARASGSNLNVGGSGQYGGTAAAVSARPVSSGGAGAISGSAYTLSGAMPEGSTLIAPTDNIRGANTGNSQFLAGGRVGQAASGTRSKAGNSLRDIAVRSSKVAANANRAANEGASYSFMSQETQSGGITLQNGETLQQPGGMATSDFQQQMDNRQRNFGQALDEVDNTEQERIAHRTRLKQNMIALMLSTLIACFSISALMKAGRKGGPYSWIFFALAGLIGAGMLAAIGLYIADCIKYIQKYNEEEGWAWAGIVLGALMVGSIAISYINFSGKEAAKADTATKEAVGSGLKEGAAEGAKEAAKTLSKQASKEAFKKIASEALPAVSGIEQAYQSIQNTTGSGEEGQ